MTLLKSMLCLLCCCLTTSVWAQRVVLSGADSLEIERLLTNEGKDLYRFSSPGGFDDQTYADVKRMVDRKIKESGYTWPYRVRLPLNTPTYWHLLAHKYGISAQDIATDCMEQQWYTLYDSLMDRAIVEYFGKDFYRATYTESLLLDKAGKGLVLPFIKSPEATAAAIKEALPFVDTLKYDSWRAGPSKYLYFVFKRGRVEHAFIAAETVILFEIEEFSYLQKEIIRRLNRLAWEGPKFKGRQADAAVLFSFDENKLTFWSTGL